MLKKHGEWWLPKTEELGLKWFDNPRGERPEVIDAALRLTAGRQVALDVGAHVGTWTCELVKHFAHTHAFEPVNYCWGALLKNLWDRGRFSGRFTPWLVAVGDKFANCFPHFTANASMTSYIGRDEPGPIPMIALDYLPWGQVSLLKIDVEGYEYFVLKGARILIERHHPTIVIEWKPHRLNRYGELMPEIEAMLHGWGYQMAEQLEIDRIYV